jgi:hypothetical protein
MKIWGMLCAVVLTALLSTAALAQTDPALDGQIFLSDEGARTSPPGPPDGKAGSFGPFGGEAPFVFTPPKAGKGVIYQREIAHWKDPLTLPHSRAECVKWSSGHIPFDGDWKTCIGWKVQWQWMVVTAWLSVTTTNPEDIRKSVNECFTDAAVVGAVAGVISGGSAALGTFEGVMKGCLVAKLTDLVSVRAYTTAAWGPWQ